jgi:hypothetical protein
MSRQLLRLALERGIKNCLECRNPKGMTYQGMNTNGTLHVWRCPRCGHYESEQCRPWAEGVLERSA